MRIVHLEVRNFRGIKELNWAPSPTMNCLIGPGDSTKTTVLDAIELVLNPKSYFIADDSDFFDLNVDTPIKITATLVDLPNEFKSDDRYGMHLRGWRKDTSKVEDEPGEGLEDALSIRVTIDKSLEARWSVFNNRIGDEDSDPPSIRYKDTKHFATTRLGPYAERHLSWGRQSVLTRIGEKADSITFQLAQASRAAREAFRENNKNVFEEAVTRAETLGKHFSVPVREKYAAELDVEGASFTAGGIALHDGKLPLRRLGTGSSRLIVSALQHDAGSSHIALIDEVEHGLEPHRIARLLKYLKSPTASKEQESSQIFMTTHSLVVIRELSASEILAVRSDAGLTTIRPVAMPGTNVKTVQGLIRSSPDAFLAPRVLIGEGKTEHGLLRGLDAYWSQQGQDSFALKGTIAIDGGGNSQAPVFAEHLLDLGYSVFLLLDTDEKAPADKVAGVKQKGGSVIELPDDCAMEERIFLDVPWTVVQALVGLAEEYVGTESVRTNINNRCKEQSLALLTDLSLPTSLDDPVFRRVIGKVAKSKNNPWFKDVTKGERLAEVIAPCLNQIPDKPLAKTIAIIRGWIDG